MRNWSSLIALSGLLALAPAIASAHEHQVFQIGTQTYEFTVGSLNEPVAVDDKSGVELSVKKVEATGEEHDDSVAHAEEDEAAAAVTGLESTLKVQISAGGKTVEKALTTVYGEPGSYKAIFIPTVQTTYAYRFIGTIDGTAVDLTFTCNPAGHPATPEDTTPVEMSAGVTRLSKAGAFGCPAAKDDLGFPEPAGTLVALSEKDGGSSSTPALALGTLGFVFGLAALARTRRKSAALMSV